jgi:hypothetical protein
MSNPLNVPMFIYNLRGEFTTQYAATLDRVLELGTKVIVCTIYYPCFEGWFSQSVSCIGLYVMNSIITSEGTTLF